MSETSPEYPLLDSINSPADLRLLSEDQLPALADELRQFLIHSTSQTGGHLGSGLGAVEITIALHYLFNTPEDLLVWDVGHQCYPHKILTGRKERMSTMRKKDGLSGFPKISESDYDHFGTGHSSTSISAALGMAIGNYAQHKNGRTVAIIGDGGMSAGMAFEALNHGGDIHRDLLVILNDNEMSISPNVGAMSKYLSRIWSGTIYDTVREGSKKVLGKIPAALEIAKRTEEHFKGFTSPGTLFEELGFSYFGPIDGHNLNDLLPLLRNMQQLTRPRLLHIVTQKGKGYAPAEADACKFHGVGPFDPTSGASKGSSDPQLQSYTNLFSNWLLAKGEAEPELHAITPAMREGSGLVAFSEAFPDRYHDVGIAEQHCVTVAAGMACTGLKPVVAIYSTFMQRAYDQLVHDVAIQNLDVTFAVDRAGIVGADGSTHTGSFDVGYCRCIPNLVMMAPSNADEVYRMLNTAYQHPGPAMVRYPRDSVPRTDSIDIRSTIPIGKAKKLRDGANTALLVFGSLLSVAQPIAEALDLTLVNMRFIKPLDEDMIRQLSETHQSLVTLEDSALQGGAGSAVLEFLADNGISAPVLRLGLGDVFPSQGSREQVLAEYGLDEDSIRASIESFAAQHSVPQKKAASSVI